MEMVEIPAKTELVTVVTGDFLRFLLWWMFFLTFYQHFMEPNKLPTKSMGFQEQHHVAVTGEIRASSRPPILTSPVKKKSRCEFLPQKRLKTEEFPSRTEHQHQQRHQTSTFEVANQNASEKQKL